MPHDVQKERATVRFGKHRLPVPGSRAGRVALGSSLIVVGVVGFPLPVIGFWMVAPGLLVLSKDSHQIRRFRRRSEVWSLRRYRAFRAGRGGSKSAEEIEIVIQAAETDRAAT